MSSNSISIVPCVVTLLTLIFPPIAQAISEEPMPDALISEWKPLKVTGDAIPWSRFATTKEHESCSKDAEGYDNCFIKPEYSTAMRQLDGRQVTLMGYMFPLEQSEKQKNFLIGPYPLSCPFHYHVGPSQMVEVFADKAIPFDYEPITIKGTLELRYNEESGMFYYLKEGRKQ